MIDNSVIVDNSQVDKSVSLYHRSWIRDSLLQNNAVVGDLSRVTSSTINEHVRIDRYNLIYHSTLGRYTYTGPFDMIFKAMIGSFSSISYGVTIGPPDHDYSMITTHPFIYDSSYEVFEKDEVLDTHKFDRLIEIGSDVWIGCNVTILRGCKIGNGAIVGANSLVNKDVPPYAIVVGSPARIVKYRFDDKTIEKLQLLKWWEWSIEKIRNNKELFICKGFVDSL